MKRTKTAMRAEADRLFSRRVRSRGICQALGFDGLACAGPLQCAHVVRRRYLSVRWDDDNAACLCAAHHVYFTHHHLAEDRFHNQLLSPERFAELKARAEQARGRPDYEAILARLRQEVNAV
jgi:hypothetical protein